jgi:hypothetical protein
MAALEWKLAVQIAENESVIIGHVVTACGNHAAIHVETYRNAKIPATAMAAAATAAAQSSRHPLRRQGVISFHDVGQTLGAGADQLDRFQCVLDVAAQKELLQVVHASRQLGFGFCLIGEHFVEFGLEFCKCRENHR